VKILLNQAVISIKSLVLTTEENVLSCCLPCLN
jgi:hypothetical protein